MEEKKGHCEHGEFVLIEGCPKCIEQQRRTSLANEAERTGKIPEDLSVLPMDADLASPTLVKVKYPLTKVIQGGPDRVVYEGRAYTYFTEEPLAVGDVVEVPIRDTVGKAQVVEIDVPESEIAAFRDKVKTIPAGSKFIDETNRGPSYLQDHAPDSGPYGGQEPFGEDWKNIESLGPITDSRTDEEKAADGDVSTEPVQEEVPAGTKPPALVTIETQVGQPAPELLQLYIEAASLLRVAKARVITTNEDLIPATNDLAIILTCKKAMATRKAEFYGPYKTKFDQFTTALNDIMFPVLEADRITRDQVQIFQLEQNRKIAEVKRIEDEKFKLAQEEMKLKGEHTQELGTAEVPPPVPEHTRTGLGTLGGRANWKARVVDFKLLDDQWKIANESLLNNHARTTKGERPIPGVEFYNERVVTMRNR